MSTYHYCPIGKNRGKAWSTMNKGQLKWYLEYTELGRLYPMHRVEARREYEDKTIMVRRTYECR